MPGWACASPADKAIPAGRLPRPHLRRHPRGRGRCDGETALPNEICHRLATAIYDTIWRMRVRFRYKRENSPPMALAGVGGLNDPIQPVSKAYTLVVLLGAVGQLPPPPVRVVPK
jgi:hypothetical protein